MRGYDDLVAEAAAVDVSGWDFSWLDGRATEERPSWGYQRLMAERWAGATAALDIQTGGGEVLAAADVVPPTAVATEGWRPNVERATRLLHPRGVVVVADENEPPLPFADGAFDLVTSRHPVRTYWGELARVLAPGGTYLSQQVGPRSAFELIEYFRGPIAPPFAREPADAAAAAADAGLEVVDLRSERLRMTFTDIGAVVYILRKVIWWVPDFSVTADGPALRRLDEQLRREGPFVAHSSRFLIEVRKPAA